MDEKKIQQILRKFAKDRDWEKFHNLRNLASSISIEAAELLEHFQWDTDKNISLNIREKEFKKKISEEVADIMLYLLRFSDIAKIDLEKSCLNKIEKNNEKYPIKLSKGKSTKYKFLKKN
jgi:NTP pyrophosphatase (non-canonical NTP hydrolase)